MSIPPISRTITVGRAPEEITAGLMNWLPTQGAGVNQPNPNRIECTFGIKSVKTFKGLAWGSFSDLEKWPVKVSMDLYASQAAPPPPPAQDRPKFCMKCGGGLPNEGNFCPGCGSPVPNAQSQAANPASPGAACSVAITAEEDMPGMLGIKQIASGPFKQKYQERLEAVVYSLEQALNQI